LCLDLSFELKDFEFQSCKGLCISFCLVKGLCGAPSSGVYVLLLDLGQSFCLLLGLSVSSVLNRNLCCGKGAIGIGEIGLCTGDLAISGGLFSLSCCDFAFPFFEGSFCGRSGSAGGVGRALSFFGGGPGCITGSSGGVLLRIEVTLLDLSVLERLKCGCFISLGSFKIGLCRRVSQLSCVGFIPSHRRAVLGVEGILGLGLEISLQGGKCLLGLSRFDVGK